MLIAERLDGCVRRGSMTQEQADRVMDVVNRATEYPTQAAFMRAVDAALWPDGNRPAWADEMAGRWYAEDEKT